ncbi:hypothetical protein Tco_0953081 [Tanacetum coccineum]|uniref:Uncharacterized protein n=1 Tax=Tanacetum coccineum TaxID=301880 RepID=A0ABQ5DYW4_9ASTR
MSRGVVRTNARILDKSDRRVGALPTGGGMGRGTVHWIGCQEWVKMNYVDKGMIVMVGVDVFFGNRSVRNMGETVFRTVAIDGDTLVGWSGREGYCYRVSQELYKDTQFTLVGGTGNGQFSVGVGYSKCLLCVDKGVIERLGMNKLMWCRGVVGDGVFGVGEDSGLQVMRGWGHHGSSWTQHMSRRGTRKQHVVQYGMEIGVVERSDCFVELEKIAYKFDWPMGLCGIACVDMDGVSGVRDKASRSECVWRMGEKGFTLLMSWR